MFSVAVFETGRKMIELTIKKLNLSNLSQGNNILFDISLKNLRNYSTQHWVCRISVQITWQNGKQKSTSENC